MTDIPDYNAWTKDLADRLADAVETAKAEPTVYDLLQAVVAELGDLRSLVHDVLGFLVMIEGKMPSA